MLDRLHRGRPFGWSRTLPHGRGRWFAQDEPDLKIALPAFIRLLEASAEAAKIENFGLRLSERRLLSNLGPDGLLAREQQTVRKAMEALAHYIGLHSDGIILRIENRDDLVVISPVVSDQRGRPWVRRRN